MPGRSLTPKLAVLLAALLAVGCAAEQAPQNAGPQTAQTISSEAIQVTLWPDGLQPLNDGWLEHDGDNLAWADPSYNDNSWQSVELDDLGAAQPGWRWYRLHLVFPSGHPHLHLLISGGVGIYELFVNGRKDGSTEFRTALGVERPVEQVFSLAGDATDVTLALRTCAPGVYATWHLPLFLAAAVGTPDAIANEQQAMQSQRLYAALPSIAIDLVLLLAGIAAFALYRSQRRHTEYLWLGLYLLLLGLSNLLLACVQNGLVPLAFNNLIADPLVYFFTIAQIEFTFSFAGRRVTRPWRMYEALLLTPLVLNGLVWAGRFPSGEYLLAEAFSILPAAILLPAFLLLWYRRGNAEAGWLILPSLLPLATASLYDLGTVSIYLHWGFADFLDNPIMLGPVPLQLADLGDFLFLLAIGVVMFFRFTRVSRDQARAAAELDAAREIQQRLVPVALPSIPGCRIQAAYLPAEEVGGDFYQILAQPDRSSLIVIGDVSGKGLKAAMTGAQVLGALQSLAQQDLSPSQILSRLNTQLTASSDGGFVTCLCADIAPGGTLIVANAGHLAPYRNGEEIPLDSGLPLGITDAQYPESTFTLAPGDSLTFLSDGVVEAQSSTGELFGFDRTRAISRESAEAIAQAAQSYGQSDDITVLTLHYNPAELTPA